MAAAKAAATAFLVVAFTLFNFWFIFLSVVSPDHQLERALELIAADARSSKASSESRSSRTSSSNDGLEQSFTNFSSTGEAPQVPPDAGDNSHGPPEKASTDHTSDPSTDTNKTTSNNNSEECEVSKGKWIPDTTPPIYTNETCKFIQPNQNCIKNGRPDREYLRWRWKPDDCELPWLDPAEFLRIMKNKKMIFVGDSMARNHMQSLLCALAQVEEPHKLEKPEVIFFEESEKEMRWGFDKHNFTLTHIWSPFLVRFKQEKELYKVTLDTPDDIWSSKVHDYDIAVISTGYWYYRPSVYYVNNTILGCNPCEHVKSNRIERVEAYRIAHISILDYMVKKFRGFTILRTVTVDHFEHGAWYNGGVCNRTMPFSAANVSLPFMSSEMNKIQVEEFKKVEKLADSRLSILDVTRSAYMRPDGHPNFFKIQHPNKPPQNDCLHWCLPGPVDTWNQLIFHTVTKLQWFSKKRLVYPFAH